MALNSTTLVGAIGNTDTYFGVASTTGISNPTPATGLGFTYLQVEDEMMFVLGVNTATNVVSVNRGQLGTQAVAHGPAAAVVAGLPGDFTTFKPYVATFTTAIPASQAGAPQTGATLVASSNLIHFTGTTALVNITYTGQVNPVTVVFDGSSTGLTWTAAGNINVAGTATTAKSSVSFRYDASIQKWIPSRLA